MSDRVDRSREAMRDAGLIPAPPTDPNLMSPAQREALSLGKALVARKGYGKVTVEALGKYLERLTEHGNRTRAALEAGLSYQSVYSVRDIDQDFKDLEQEAYAIYCSKIEAEIHRRAVEGWDEPVFSPKTGQQVGTIRKYSDRLMERHAMRHIKEYRDKVDVDHTVKGGIVVVPMPAATEADFERRIAAASQHEVIDVEAKPALPEETKK